MPKYDTQDLLKHFGGITVSLYCKVASTSLDQNVRGIVSCNHSDIFHSFHKCLLKSRHCVGAEDTKMQTCMKSQRNEIDTSTDHCSKM